jgi:hypothetical protein
VLLDADHWATLARLVGLGRGWGVRDPQATVRAVAVRRW